MDRPSDLRARVRSGLAYGAGTALVAAFCWVTASQMESVLRETYWAPLAAVVVLYPDSGATRKAGWVRFVGTIIGSALGWASAALWHGQVVIFALAVMLAVGLCHVLNLDAAARLAAVAVIVITIIPRPEPPHVVALHRFVEVSYGVVCAMAYSALVDLARRWFWPQESA